MTPSLSLWVTIHRQRRAEAAALQLRAAMGGGGVVGAPTSDRTQARTLLPMALALTDATTPPPCSAKPVPEQHEERGKEGE